MPIIYICDVCERKIGNHPLDRPIIIPQLGGQRVLCVGCATPEELGEKINLPFIMQWGDELWPDEKSE